MAYQKLENLLQITSDIHKSFANITCYCRNARRDITQKSQPLEEIALEFNTLLLNYFTVKWRLLGFR